MSNEVIGILAIVAMAIWILVSREAVKSKKKINRQKMITLLSAGSILTLILIISLIQNLPF